MKLKILNIIVFSILFFGFTINLKCQVINMSLSAGVVTARGTEIVMILDGFDPPSNVVSTLWYGIKFSDLSPKELTSLFNSFVPTIVFPVRIAFIENGRTYEVIYKTLKEFPRKNVKCKKCIRPNCWFVKWE